MTHLQDWFRMRATTDPTATALIDAPADEHVTYGALDEEVEVLAGKLSALGVRQGDCVGVLIPTGLPLVRLVFATMRLGAILVPLDLRLADPERAARCDLVDLSVLVVTEETRRDGLAATHAVPVASLGLPADGTMEDKAPDGTAVDLESIAPESFERHRWRLDEPVCVLFTSGTTGDPKAVVLTARNLLASATASAFRLGVLPDDRWLVCLPTYHMGGLAPIYRSTLYGTTVVLQPFEPAAVSRAIRTFGVSGISLVPTTLRRLLDADAPLEHLRFVLVGGARTPPELVDRALDRGIPLFPTYGMTEAASQIATARPDDVARDPTTVGRPLVFTTVSVLDADGEHLPRGTVGELVVSGPTVTPGYLGDEEATDHAFGPYGFHTGDVGLLGADGQVHVRGRLDDRIVTGGENVHPADIEAVIRDHPAVSDVAVVGLDDPEWGQRVGALIVSTAKNHLSTGHVERHCEDRLADYKRPRTIEFVDELPRTASGTVDRQAVRDRLATDGFPDDERSGGNGNAS